VSELAERARSARQLWAVPGSSHDRLIRLARIFMPLAVLVLVVLLAVAPVTVGRDISFVLSKDRVDVAHERLRVSEALYRGHDSKGQPFALRAASAVQATSRDPVVKLNDLSARIALTGGLATIDAGHGRYDMNNQHVMLDGPVLFRSADGYRLQTRDVTLDITAKTLASGDKADGTMPLGTFSGGRLAANLETRTVTLDRGARLHIVQSRSRARP
jgi:lipopolysaccharide export system protein LptC